MLLDLEPIEQPGLGSPSQMAARVLSLVPDAWVGDSAKTPGVGGLWLLAQALGIGLADPMAAIAYAALQTRIATATDINLDNISNDFFGGMLPRNPGESDGSFRSRLRTAIFQNKATRAGMVFALGALGLTFVLVEDGNPTDLMALGTYGGLGTVGALGAGNNAQGAVWLRVALPLPSGVTQPQVLSVINNVKPEGVIVWVSFL
jgi:hypothetical protein